VQSAIGAGTEVLAGGAGADGWTYQPTVLYDPPQDNVAWREETFGPVASIVVADDVDHAIAIANDSVFGLSAGVLTRDIQKGLHVARQVKAGAVHVGMHPFQSDALAPVGGFGMSGIGRSGGKYSVEHFTELKWISIELGETPRPF
jgi:acyl-CoA reductase-like NAD-dependent aldehyde dehydrogenase